MLTGKRFLSFSSAAVRVSYFKVALFDGKLGCYFFQENENIASNKHSHQISKSSSLFILCSINEGVRESGCDVIYSTDRLTTNKTGNYKPLIMSSDQERANSESEQSLVSGISKSFSDEMSQ